MIFSRAKLPNEAASTMRICPIESVSAYALMFAPVYIYLERNQKFVAVKAPLDFFVPAELERLKPLRSFYLPPFADQALRFRTAARKVRALLTWTPPSRQSSDPYPEVVLPPAPFELSDAILRIVGPLWSTGPAIESFFVCVFVNELCDLLSPEILLESREKDVQSFETALFRSSLAVFFALHLGNLEVGFLNQLRREVFEKTLRAEPGVEVLSAGQSEEIDALLRASAAALTTGKIEKGIFESRKERAAQKLVARLKRVGEQFVEEGAAMPTIRGPEGFLDV